jgi:Short C-terminal domain
MALPGTATVAYTYDTGDLAPDGEPIVGMTVAINAPGLTPYSATLQDRVPSSLRPYVTTGSVLPVDVDEADPNLVRIDWEQVEQSTSKPPPPSSAAAGDPLPAMPSVPPISAPPMMPAVPPVPSAQPAAPVDAGKGDPLDRIAKLNALRESGALSLEEFEAAKAKILGEL